MHKRIPENLNTPALNYRNMRRQNLNMCRGLPIILLKLQKPEERERI